MQVRAVAVPVAVDLAAGLAFALSWGLRWQGCAPPSVLCPLPGVACIAVCSDAWAQWTMTFPWGLLLGVVPSLMAFVAVFLTGLSTPPAAPTSRASLVLSSLSVFLMATGVDVVFLESGDALLPWAFILASAPLFALSLVRAGVGRSWR